MYLLPMKMAESEGFEPPEPFDSTVFKTAAFDHSASSPEFINLYRVTLRIYLFLPKCCCLSISIGVSPLYYARPALRPFGVMLSHALICSRQISRPLASSPEFFRFPCRIPLIINVLSAEDLFTEGLRPSRKQRILLELISVSTCYRCRLLFS